MFSNVLIKLVIIGANPSNGEFSIVLNDEGIIPETRESVQELAQFYISHPPEWYSIRKQTFVEFEGNLFLIYSVCIPQNVQVKAGRWALMSDLEHLSLLEKQVVLEGAKL